MNSMRNKILIIGILVAFAACRPEKIRPYEKGEAGSVNSIAGVWKGSTAIQRDNDAERKNFPFKSLDITAPLGFTQYKLTLNAANGQPSNFTIDYGTGVPFFKFTSGNWEVDNTEKVGTIKLYNGLDTAKFVLGAYNLIDQDRLLLKRSKQLLGKDAITYEFNFIK
jgi:hypothetical protein